MTFSQSQQKSPCFSRAVLPKGRVHERHGSDVTNWTDCLSKRSHIPVGSNKVRPPSLKTVQVDFLFDFRSLLKADHPSQPRWEINNSTKRGTIINQETHEFTFFRFATGTKKKNQNEKETWLWRRE